MIDGDGLRALVSPGWLSLGRPCFDKSALFATYCEPSVFFNRTLYCLLVMLLFSGNRCF